MINVELDRLYYPLSSVMYPWLVERKLKWDQMFGYTNIEFESNEQLIEFLKYIGPVNENKTTF